MPWPIENFQCILGGTAVVFEPGEAGFVLVLLLELNLKGGIATSPESVQKGWVVAGAVAKVAGCLF